MVEPNTPDDLSQILRDAIVDLSALEPEDSHDEKPLVHHPRRKDFADLSLAEPPNAARQIDRALKRFKQ